MIENYLNAIDEDDGDADEDRGDHMTLLSCFQEFCLFCLILFRTLFAVLFTTDWSL